MSRRFSGAIAVLAVVGALAGAAVATRRRVHVDAECAEHEPAGVWPDACSVAPPWRGTAPAWAVTRRGPEARATLRGRRAPASSRTHRVAGLRASSRGLAARPRRARPRTRIPRLAACGTGEQRAARRPELVPIGAGLRGPEGLAATALRDRAAHRLGLRDRRARAVVGGHVRGLRSPQGRRLPRRARGRPAREDHRGRSRTARPDVVWRQALRRVVRTRGGVQRTGRDALRRADDDPHRAAGTRLEQRHRRRAEPAARDGHLLRL